MKQILNIKVLSIIVCFFLATYIKATPIQNANIVVGAEQIDTIKSLLKDKRVGLVVNQTSCIGEQQHHLLDILIENNIHINCVFAPEHGFRGIADAGATVKDSKDLKTGVPIVSLYGKNRKPTVEQLDDIDVIVFDVQDVGTRFFNQVLLRKTGGLAGPAQIFTK